MLPADFLEQLAKDLEGGMRLTLPDGKQVLGKIDQIQRSERGVDRLSGKLQHPESGAFSFQRLPGGPLSGTLGFDSATTEWKIVPSSDSKGFQWVQSPLEDGFRPRNMEMPKAGVLKPTPPRDEADAALGKNLKVEEIAPGKLRIGEVLLDKTARSIRFPGVVNMHDGTVEYAVVSSTGKRHEALFSTSAAPRDIHVAMLLLGVKPAKCVETPDKALAVPQEAAVEVRAEWKTDDVMENRSIKELVTVARTSSQMRTPANTPSAQWLYNGSRFNAAGFAASVEGSIVSLIHDDLALINNAASDRADDEIHIPDSSILPKTDTPVTLILSLSSVSEKPASSP